MPHPDPVASPGAQPRGRRPPPAPGRAARRGGVVAHRQRQQEQVGDGHGGRIPESGQAGGADAAGAGIHRDREPPDRVRPAQSGPARPGRAGPSPPRPGASTRRCRTRAARRCRGCGRGRSRARRVPPTPRRSSRRRPAGRRCRPCTRGCRAAAALIRAPPDVRRRPRRRPRVRACRAGRVRHPTADASSAASPPGTSPAPARPGAALTSYPPVQCAVGQGRPVGPMLPGEGFGAQQQGAARQCLGERGGRRTGRPDRAFGSPARAADRSNRSSKTDT